MKNFFAFTFCILFFLTSFLIIGKKQEKSININSQNIEKKAVFFSYIEFNNYMKDKEENISKKNIRTILENLEKNGFNMIIVHVRAFSDAIYNSKIYPISDIVKVKGKNPSYDILSYIITEAKKKNIEVHAWINPYRVSNNTDLDEIKIDNPAYDLIENGCVKKVEEKGIFYNPACLEVNKLIIQGILELVNNYDIDGIHFDDYFYPDKNIDLDNYEKYIDDGSNLSLTDFRIKNILSLIKDVYWNIKSVNNNIEFGISPEGNIDNDYNNHFLDIKKILSEKGYIDYIMPQIYYGFENSNKPFKKTINEWNDLIKVDTIKLIPALAFYKVGSYDKYAGIGAYEWIDNDDIISKQIEYARSISRYSGFSLFRYDYLFNGDKATKTTKQEFNNLKLVIN